MNNYLLNLVLKDCKSKGWNIIGENIDSNSYLMYISEYYNTAYVYLYKNTLTFGVTKCMSNAGEVLLVEYDSIDECLDYIIEMENGLE